MWYTYAFLFSIASIVTYILKKLFDKSPNKIKYYFRYFIFYIYVCVAATVVILYSVLKPKYTGNMKAGTSLLKHADKLLNLKYQIRDIKFVSEDGGAVIIANHQSILDTIVIAHVWDKVKYNLNFIIKKELFYWGPFGLCAYLGGAIFIDRNNTKRAYDQLQVTKDYMLKEKNKVWIFPEGTRSKDYTKLLPFKKGAFNIAIEAQVPVIPIVISPYYFINKNKCIFSKGRVIVQCLDPVPTSGLTINDVPHLLEQVHAKMTVAYNKLFEEIVSL